MKTKKQYAVIDIAKYVSALLVVCVHTFPFLEMNETFNLYFIQIVCRLAVPFFFVVSAFFFFRKWSDDSQQNRAYLTKYLKRLLKLYLIWTVIYLPYTIWDYGQVGFSFSNIFGYIRDLFLNGSYYHLWFLPALMLATVLVCWMYSKKGLSFLLKTSLALYFIGYLINIYTPIWQDLPIISIFFGFFTKVFSTARNGIFFGPMYVAIGLLLAKTRRLPKKVNGIGFLVSYGLLVIEIWIYGKIGVLRDLSSMYLLLVPVSYFLVNLLLTIRLPYKPIYRSLRDDSLIIYTSHILFAKPLLILVPNAHLVVYFLTLAGAQGCSYLIHKYKDQYPILGHLI